MDNYLDKLKEILDNLISYDKLFVDEILPKIAEKYDHTIDAVKIA
jgi:hypothetical protein